MTKAVAQRSKGMEAVVQSAQNARALMGGSAAMRKAGERYLPKFEAEAARDYKARLAASWLFNGYRKTVRDMTGRVFDKPVEILEGPDQLEDWAKNIDLDGRDLSTFAREVFEDGLSGPGLSYIMVDAPARNREVTRSEAATANLRPYLKHISAERVLGFRSEAFANVQMLAQLRIMEEVEEPDPDDEFGVVTVEQVRVLTRHESGVEVQLYRKSGENWAPHEEPVMTGLAEITVIPFYANRSGFFTGEPLLDDLADVNVAHWQSQSDQRNILHVARCPILFAKGMGDKEDITISSTSATKTSNDAADLKWVEHSGRAIDAGRQDLKDLEFQMEAFGLQLLVGRSQSATGATLDAQKETSILAMTADQLQDALEAALGWMLEYAGIDGDVAVKVNKDFGTETLTTQQLQLMLTAVNTGNMSQETFWREISTVLRTGPIDPDAEKDEIRRDQGELTRDPEDVS